VPLETPARVVRELAQRGYNAEREAVTVLAGAADPQRAIERAIELAPDETPVLATEHAREAVETVESGGSSPDDPESRASESSSAPDPDPPVSTGTSPKNPTESGGGVPPETKGSSDGGAAGQATGVAVETTGTVADESEPGESTTAAGERTRTDRDRPASDRDIEVSGDIQSTGTGDYGDFVTVFRDRYEKLAGHLRGRVTHRPTDAVSQMNGGSEAAIIGMVSDVRSTSGGHVRIELEDTNGTYPCLVMKDRDLADEARELLHDEVVAIEGRLSDDNADGDGILFADDIHFPDIPRTYSPSTADRPVQAALISDVHVGSDEFRPDAWNRFADWLHTDEAERVEYLLIAGDMVEGVGVYPGQDEELEIVDIYEQYEAFSEHLKSVPGDMEVVMIPGNHDAVRLAEPQPAFDEELREIMSAHDATISANPSTVTVEGVSVLMYHGVSLDELIAQLPDEHATYDRPQDAMAQLLKKRHVAPPYGGMIRLAPEAEDHLVIEEVPDIFHTGHVHKLGYGTYHNVLTINSSCWQSQTDFQKSVNLDPDVGYAPIVDLDTLDLTIRQFL
jgi:DNA polymerase II small subunit